MPIADSELSKPGNSHLLRPASETVYAALRAWRDAPDHAETWWLVIEHGERHFTALRFGDLRDAIAHPDLNVHMNTRLAELPSRRDGPEQSMPGVITPVVVEQAALGTMRALKMLLDSPGQVLIVLRQAEFHGILSGSARAFAFSDQPLLAMLEAFEAPGDSDTHILPHRPGLSDDPDSA